MMQDKQKFFSNKRDSQQAVNVENTKVSTHELHMAVTNGDTRRVWELLEEKRVREANLARRKELSPIKALSYDDRQEVVSILSRIIKFENADRDIANGSRITDLELFYVPYQNGIKIAMRKDASGNSDCVPKYAVDAIRNLPANSVALTIFPGRMSSEHDGYVSFVGNYYLIHSVNFEELCQHMENITRRVNVVSAEYPCKEDPLNQNDAEGMQLKFTK